MADDEIEVTVTVPDEDNTEDVDNDGIPDGVETGIALERASNAELDALEAKDEAASAQVNASLATDIGIDAHDRIAELESGMAAMAQTLGQVTETLVSLRDLVAANAQATASQLEAGMHGQQPEDTAPTSSHWLNRKVFG